MTNLLNQLQQKQFLFLKSNLYTIPKFQIGDILRIRMILSKQDRRKQVFTGQCLAFKKKGFQSSILLGNWIYKELVKKNFPLYSKLISSVQLLHQKNGFRSSKLKTHQIKKSIVS